ncbi:FAD-dependent oxidoreductase [Gordonia polyisoprenivorans]|uniref:FAD-dependent oxidoreductase n=1 Tax=Gordonia polyisoprenivorans TaxID=84595 RepID=UPI001F0A6B0D|nr:FAD-dependent oxidoreductase [Gordonia polyisoprenivorans]
MKAVIVGAGIIGCALARELARLGLDVEVIDRGAPGAGTTAHGEGNVLVSDKGTGTGTQLSRTL